MSKAEQILISSVIQSGDLSVANTRGISTDHFSTFPDVWDFISRYHTNHGATPRIPVFKAKFPDFPLGTVDDVNFGCDELEESYTRRVLAELLRETASKIRSGDVFTARSDIRSAVDHLDAQFQTNRILDGIRDQDVFLDSLRKKQLRLSEHGMSGVPTGFPTLNDRTGGFQPGELWIWGARFGHGKSWALTKVASEALIAGLNVEFITLEQSAKAISWRIHTFLAHHLGYTLSNRSFNSGRGLDIDVYQQLLEEMDQKIPGNLSVMDSSRGRVSPRMVSGRMEQTEPDVVLLDYLTLMCDNKGQRASEDWRIAASISGDVKIVAQEHDTPIVAAAQINRQGDGAKPSSASNLAQADAIGQDADGVVTQVKLSPRAVQMRLAKYRHGEDGFDFWVKFDPDVGDVAEITADQARDITLDDSLEA